ncbi:hypothetical protein G7046_g8390 [Stylonectria norvegica]|nr:hypothetical protein G7046_g8390 [Stylonectria norvegica]
MSSLYQQSIPVFVKYLKNLSALLEKSKVFCDTTGLKHEDLLTYRLISDMQGITYQVQSCCNTSKFVAQRMGHPNTPVFEDNETTFEQLQERITNTIKLLDAVAPETINGKEDAEVFIDAKFGKFKFTGQSYISEMAIPNFHFHLTTAYCIMRQKGVPIGAFDYLKDVMVKVE